MCFNAKLKILEHRQQRIAEVRAKYEWLMKELEATKQYLMLDPNKWLRECKAHWHMAIFAIIVALPGWEFNVRPPLSCPHPLTAVHSLLFFPFRPFITPLKLRSGSAKPL